MTLGENSSPDEIRMVMKTIMRMGGAVGALKRGTTRGILYGMGAAGLADVAGASLPVAAGAGLVVVAYQGIRGAFRGVADIACINYIAITEDVNSKEISKGERHRLACAREAIVEYMAGSENPERLNRVRRKLDGAVEGRWPRPQLG